MDRRSIKVAGESVWNANEKLSFKCYKNTDENQDSTGFCEKISLGTLKLLFLRRKGFFYLFTLNNNNLKREGI